MERNNPIDNIEKLMRSKDMQFRDFRITEVETRAAGEDDEEMIVRGVACVFNTPAVLYEYDGIEYKEQIDARALDECDMSDVIFNINHCGRVYARTRNGSLKLFAMSDGLHMKARLLKNDRGHEELYRDIKEGLLDRMSFAFVVRSQAYDRDSHLRTIMAIKKIYDVSAVDIPAYDTTEISARSFFDAEREKELAESEERENKLKLAKAKYAYFGG